MISGSVRGAAKSVTIVADTACPTVGSAPADLMMSRAAPLAPLTYRTNTRLQPFPLFIDHLTEESIPGGVHTRLLHRRVSQVRPCLIATAGSNNEGG